MARLLLCGTHGPDDPTRATLPFHMGKGAVEGGHEVAIVLMGDASYLMKDATRDAIAGVAMPPLKELFQFATEHQVRVYV
jgi:predicted peroxiredoxin